MVARITRGKSMQKLLNYNEQKCNKSKAVCIADNGFLKDVGNMTFYDKLKTFAQRTSLNERAKSNAVHISLSFPKEEILAKEIFEAIAKEYIEAIGFAGQPYLLYRHLDTAHPHMHIIT